MTLRFVDGRTDSRTDQADSDVVLNMMKKALSGLKLVVQTIVLTIVFSAMAAASAGLLALQVIREF